MKVLRLNSNPLIFYLEPELVRTFRKNPEPHLSPFRGEFDGIGEIVVEDLLELGGIEEDILNLRANLGLELDALLGRERPQDVFHLSDQPRQMDGLEAELHFPGFDLCQVEHVVDELQKVAG